MRWREGRRSDNVEDSRGSGGGGGGFKLGIGGLVIAAIAYFAGVDPRLIMGLMEATQTAAPEAPPQTGAPADEAGQFVSVVLADTEDTWTAIFNAAGQTYQPPKLRLFSGGTQSGCGTASAQVGPFYCPADSRVYIDLDFYNQLAQQFKFSGDFAQAYVIAHEVGHHVQNLLGTADKVHGARQNASEREGNALQVRMELQADCYAGVWAHHADKARQILESGDVDEALRAAAAVGDDRIQQKTQGQVVPDSFTHGSAEQRQRWFKAGLESGKAQNCDTFGARSL
ncbi:MAG: neutral zinc metallopeptidase [Steroidobacteraceae bacterium]